MHTGRMLLVQTAGRIYETKIYIHVRKQGKRERRRRTKIPDDLPF